MDENQATINRTEVSNEIEEVRNPQLKPNESEAYPTTSEPKNPLVQGNLPPSKTFKDDLVNIGKWFFHLCESIIQWIMKRYGIQNVHLNYKEYLLKLLVSIILFSFFQITITSFIRSIIDALYYRPITTCPIQENPGIDPSTIITLEAIKEIRKTALAENLKEVTFDQLYHKAVKSRSSFSFLIIRFLRFLWTWMYTVWESMKEIGFSSFWLAAAIWSGFDIYLNIQNTISVTFLVEENKRREDHEKQINFEQRQYLEQLIIGWNVLECIPMIHSMTISPNSPNPPNSNPSNPNPPKQRYKFTIPTEKVIHFNELLKYDEILCEKILETINAPFIPNQKEDPNCPSFMVKPLDQEVHLQFLQKVSNCVSENTKSSNYPSWALRRNPNPEVYEDAIFVVTCEKGPGVPTKHTRVWCYSRLSAIKKVNSFKMK